MDIKSLMHIEKEFVETDDEAKITKILLEFDTPEDILNQNFISKTPMLSHDFIDMLEDVCQTIKNKYKVDLTVRFRDMQGYSEEELKDIFHKNLELVSKGMYNEEQSRKRLAYMLIVTGFVFFFAMILINRLWVTESIWKDIFVYTADIATTVTFWEAMTILVVERREYVAQINKLSNSVNSLHFEQK